MNGCGKWEHGYDIIIIMDKNQSDAGALCTSLTDSIMQLAETGKR